MARTTRGHCRFMRLSIRPVVGLSVLLIGVWGATAEVLAQPGVIKLTYVKSMTLKDGSAGARVKEEGTICIDATCRYRIDRSRGPVRTSEIVDLCKGERISFDPSANIAMVSELPVPLPAPGGRAIVRWSGATNLTLNLRLQPIHSRPKRASLTGITEPGRNTWMQKRSLVY